MLQSPLHYYTSVSSISLYMTDTFCELYSQKVLLLFNNVLFSLYYSAGDYIYNLNLFPYMNSSVKKCYHILLSHSAL